MFNKEENNFKLHLNFFISVGMKITNKIYENIRTNGLSTKNVVFINLIA